MSPIDHRTGSPALTAPCRKQPGGTSLKCNARTTGARASFPKEFAESAHPARIGSQPFANKTDARITTSDRRGVGLAQKEQKAPLLGGGGQWGDGDSNEAP